MPNILIIEDDISTNKLVVRVLQNFSVFSALNAEDGFAMAQEYQPDLILLDMNLPDIPGWELVAMMKDHEDLYHIPVIAVSVQDDVLYIQRALDAGCAEYLRKPFAIEDLRTIVDSYL